MNVVPFLPVHFIGLTLQDDQQYMQELLSLEYGECLSIAGPAWSAFEEGECVGTAGFAFSEPHKAIVWSLFGENITARNMLCFHRAVAYEFDRIKAKRIECITRDIPVQHRWAKILGMTLETPEGMKQYFSDGETGFLYTKVKNDTE